MVDRPLPGTVLRDDTQRRSRIACEGEPLYGSPSLLDGTCLSSTGNMHAFGHQTNPAEVHLQGLRPSRSRCQAAVCGGKALVRVSLMALLIAL